MNGQALSHDAAVRGMFARIAGIYDFMNHFLSFGIDRRWRRTLARNVKIFRTNRVLDLACGTFDVALAIAREKPAAKIPAMDFCMPMLKPGQKKLQGANGKRIFPAAGDARKLPLSDMSVDCVTMAFGIRNITPRSAALAEMLRVLVRGGRVCILEFASGRDRIMGGIYNFYLGRVLPVVGNALAKDRGAYSYLAETIEAFPAADEFSREIEKAGFVNVTCQRLTAGIATLHIAEKPE